MKVTQETSQLELEKKAQIPSSEASEEEPSIPEVPLADLTVAEFDSELELESEFSKAAEIFKLSKAQVKRMFAQAELKYVRSQGNEFTSAQRLQALRFALFYWQHLTKA